MLENSIRLLNPVADFFLWRPDRIWMVAFVFGALSLAAAVAKIRFRQVRWVPLFSAYLLWMAFGFLEHSELAHRGDIRVDVVLIWPFIFATTAVLVGASIPGVIRTLLGDSTPQTPAR